MALSEPDESGSSHFPDIPTPAPPEMNLESIHSACEAENIWMGPDSSNDSRGSVSDISDGNEPHEMSPYDAGMNEPFPINPVSTIDSSQASSVEPTPTPEGSEVRREPRIFPQTSDHPLQEAQNPQQTALDVHDQISNAVCSPPQSSPLPQIACWSPSGLGNAHGGVSLAAEIVHEGEGSEEDGCELFEHFELDGISKEEFRDWVKQAPPEDLEIARAEVLRDALAEDLKELEGAYPPGQAVYREHANTPNDSASIQLQQENDASQPYTPNKKCPTSTSQFSVCGKPPGDRPSTTILPSSDQSLPQRLFLSLVRPQIDCFVKKHPFYTSPHIPHTVTERRDFTRDVYDYSRARGLTTAQSQVEVKKAANTYRKCRRLAKVLQWIDIAREQARSIEDELQRIRDEEGWDTDDIEGNFSDDNSNAGTDLGTEIDDSAELLNEATKMIKTATGDRGFSPMIYSGSNEEVPQKELKGKLKRSFTGGETADRTSPAETHTGEKRARSSKKLKAMSAKQKDSSENYTPIPTEKQTTKGGGTVHPRKREAEEEPTMVRKDNKKRKGSPGVDESMEGLGHNNPPKPSKTKPKKQRGGEDSEMRNSAQGNGRQEHSLTANTPLGAEGPKDLKENHKKIKKDKPPKPKDAGSEVPSFEQASTEHGGKRDARRSKKKTKEKLKAKADEDGANQQASNQTPHSEPKTSKLQRRKEKEPRCLHIPDEEVMGNIQGVEPQRKLVGKSSRERDDINHTETQASVERPTPDFHSPDDSPSKAGNEGIVSNTAREPTEDKSSSMRSPSHPPGSKSEDKTTRVEHNTQANKLVQPRPQTARELTGPPRAQRDGRTDELHLIAELAVTPLNSASECRRTLLKSPYFKACPVVGPSKTIRKSSSAVSVIPFPPLSSHDFGLVQEKLAHEPFKLLIGVTLLNRTKGIHAIPVIFLFAEKYPTPEAMAGADELELAQATRHLGLQNIRAKRYIELAKSWLRDPPRIGRRHRKLHYPKRDDGKDIKPQEIIDDTDPRIGAWEISHLPNVGPYALDSWRIFHRDEFRGLANDWIGTGAHTKDFEPEWKRVVPKDKELRAYLRWMWLKEGWEWDPQTGSKVEASEDLMERARRGVVVWEEEWGDKKGDKGDQ
ncbi:hypothetical protein FGG08_006110 [Glutinoglossum americanum]|uniref:HhH-GPD domain-containing protein n=1 Tax=Glutinoglossum americanum TaxID=1670608 RepID=A0A9P8L0R4_9PEZI|nr:hypothetical protein FGG08_006110 [Glutinoglossum americanum]